MRDWKREIERFLASKNRTKSVVMGSRTSAQVTATRLRRAYPTLSIRSEDTKVIVTK